MARTAALAIAFLGATLWTGSSLGAPKIPQILPPPWGPVVVDSWVNSAQVRDGEQPIRIAPDTGAARRGTATPFAHLPVFGVAHGPGCGAFWVHVGPQAWVCQDYVSFSDRAPVMANYRPAAVGPLSLPYRYYFAGPDGSLAYAKRTQVDAAEPVMELDPGFAVAVVEESQLGRQSVGRTNRGLWVPMRDFHAARPLDFAGVEIADVDGAFPFAWVVSPTARVYAKARFGLSPTKEKQSRFTRVGWFEERKTPQGKMTRISEFGQWMLSRDLRHPTRSSLPSDPTMRKNEKWIDIELATQTLVAYEGTKPVFATMVSTGRGKGRHPFATPKGEHRVWVKLLTSVMDNLEDPGARSYYRIEDVPYVQYFSKGVGLHAAFWHRSFGRVRSHGCVNLTSTDAARLFWWTGPRLPAGWNAALPSTYDRGTLIRVR